MAIYSCSLASIGRTTHASGTAGAHLRYISRDGAAPVVEAHVIPLDPTEARTWMDREEHTARANARLVDKVRVAIPRELSAEDRIELVRSFVRDITQDRVPWMYAIHQQGEDRHNPHAHIVVRDRDIDTGKRVLRLSDSIRDRIKAGLEPKAVDWIRERWEHHANAALERAGHDVRIDRRSLEAQGIDRVPTIHLGPQAQHIERHVQRATSKRRKNAAGREIDYPAIDQGRTRQERHAEIVDINLERAMRSSDIETRLRAQFERDQQRLDRALEKNLAQLERARTQEDRQLRASFRAQAVTLRAERRTQYQGGVTDQRQKLGQRIFELRQRQAAERDQLSQRHNSMWGRLTRAVDFTGGTKRRQSKARQKQIADHKQERSALARASHESRTALRDAIAHRFAPQIEGLEQQRKSALAAMKEMHGRGEAMADAKRQLREAERERERIRTEEAIRLAKMQSHPLDGPSSDPAPSGGAGGSPRAIARDDFEHMRQQFAEQERRHEAMRRQDVQRRRDPAPGR